MMFTRYQSATKEWTLAIHIRDGWNASISKTISDNEQFNKTVTRNDLEYNSFLIETIRNLQKAFL